MATDEERRYDFTLALNERDVEDALSNAHMVGDARTARAMTGVLAWLRGEAQHPSAAVIARAAARNMTPLELWQSSPEFARVRSSDAV